MLYVSVGSASNVDEYGMDEERRRAAILAIDLTIGRERSYASGLRNPVGMDFVPGTSTLWTAVNERDEIGDDISPTIELACAKAVSMAVRTAIMASRTCATPTRSANCSPPRCCPVSRSARTLRRWASPLPSRAL
jgi:hypothetical protein